MAANDCYKPKGRAAHSGISSRQKSSWDSEIEAIYNTTQGPMTASEFNRARQKADPAVAFNMVLGNPSDSVYSRRSCSCGGRIEFSADGKAVCTNPSCSTVFNDGGNIEGMVQITKHYGHDNRTTTITNKKDTGHRKRNMHAIMRRVA